MIYDFNEQLDKGKRWEMEIDEIASVYFDIEKVSVSQDRSGTDRIWTHKKSKMMTMPVQYKGDEKADKYKNAFIEITSCENPYKPGWAIKCSSIILIHYMPISKVIRILSLPLIKYALLAWSFNYELKRVSNYGWVTLGYAIPLTVIDSTVSFGTISQEDAKASIPIEIKQPPAQMLLQGMERPYA